MWATRPPSGTALILGAIGIIASSETSRHRESIQAASWAPHLSPTQTAPPQRSAPGSAAVCGDVSMAGLHGDVLRLARLWKQRHPCEALPRCGHQDRLAVLHADLDDALGVERVIATNRFGVAMYSAAGELLATWDGTGCGPWPDDGDPQGAGGQRIRLSEQQQLDSPRPQLVVRTRRFAHCGELKGATVLSRVGTGFGEILEIDEGGDGGCGISEWQVHTRISVPHPGEVVVRYDGREHRMDGDSDAYGPWKPIHDRCTLRASVDGRFVAVEDAAERCHQPNSGGGSPHPCRTSRRR